MRYLLPLLLSACVAENPDFDPTAAALYWSQGDAGADLRNAPDLASPTCGRAGEPCCRDVAGRAFCGGEMACFGERCAVPDMAVVDFAIRPDMARAPGTVGGPCERDEDCAVDGGYHRVKCTTDPDNVPRLSCCRQSTPEEPFRCFP